MTALLIGNARCSTDEQDLTVQREGLAALGVTPDRIHVDHGLTGCNRERLGSATPTQEPGAPRAGGCGQARTITA